MYILEVIPIVKGLPLDTLTYYSKETVAIGDIVSINIGNRKDVNALVIDADEARNRKQSIKSSDWNTKKINKVKAKNIIESALLISIYKVAVTPDISDKIAVGTLLSLLFTKKIWEKIINVSQDTTINLAENNLVVKNNKVLNKEEIDLHIYASKKEIPNKNSSPSVSGGVIQFYTTPCLDTLLTYKVNKVTLHNTRSRYYVHAHYRIDMLEIIKNILNDCKIIYEEKNEEYNLYKINILQDEFEYITPLISAITDRLIRNVYENHKAGGKGKLLIYANRKGESPLSRCYDCGMDLLCPDCKLPLVLHKKNISRFYLCHHCKYRIDINNEENIESGKLDIASDEARSAFAKQITCKHCHGWRIMPIGISTGSIASHLISHYNFLKKEKGSVDIILPIFILDRDTASTDKKMNSMLKIWDAEGGILITNDIGIEDRSIKSLMADYSIIISLDGLFSLPDADIETRALDILHNINRMTKNGVYMHTHLVDTSFIKMIKQIQKVYTESKNIEVYTESKNIEVYTENKSIVEIKLKQEELINSFIKKSEEKKKKLEK